MKFDQRSKSIAFILIYVIGLLFSAYALFSLKHDLVYKSQVLPLSSMDVAGPAFIKLFVIVGATFLIGLFTIAHLYTNRKTEVIQVEKKQRKKKTAEEMREEEEQTSMDMNPIKKLLSGNTGSEEKVLNKTIVQVCSQLEAGIGAVYTVKTDDHINKLKMVTSYALGLGESQLPEYEFGEGLVGQAALEQKTLNIQDIPEGYVKVVSGLGNASPTQLLILPLVQEGGELYGVVEIASFTTFDKNHENFVRQAFTLAMNKLFPAKAKKPATQEEKTKDEPKADTNKKNKKA